MKADLTFTVMHYTAFKDKATDSPNIWKWYETERLLGKIEKCETLQHVFAK